MVHLWTRDIIVTFFVHFFSVQSDWNNLRAYSIWDNFFVTEVSPCNMGPLPWEHVEFVNSFPARLVTVQNGERHLCQSFVHTCLWKLSLVLSLNYSCSSSLRMILCKGANYAKEPTSRRPIKKKESWDSSFSESWIVHSYRKVPFESMVKHNSRMLCSKIMKLLLWEILAKVPPFSGTVTRLNNNIYQQLWAKRMPPSVLSLISLFDLICFSFKGLKRKYMIQW